MCIYRRPMNRRSLLLDRSRKIVAISGTIAVVSMVAAPFVLWPALLWLAIASTIIAVGVAMEARRIAFERYLDEGSAGSPEDD